MFSESVALLDTNVLYPMALCDLLLSLAEHDVFQPRWSDDILEELRRNLVVDGRCTPAKGLRRVHLMREAFPEATVSDYESLAETLTNDAGDRHVLAAAMRSNAEYLVTNNLKHFPQEALSGFNGSVVTPEHFLCGLFQECNDFTFELIVHKLAHSLRRPQMQVTDVLAALRRQVPSFVAAYEDRFLPQFPGLSAFESEYDETSS